MSFEKFITLYKQHLISEKNLSTNTIKNYEIDLKQFFDQSVTNKNLKYKLESFISYLRNNSLPSTINRKISVIKNYLKFLQTEKIVDHINLDHFNSFKNNHKIPKALNKKQVNAIIQSLMAQKNKNSKMYSMLLKLMFLSGLRISEAINLKWTDLNIKDLTLNIYGKGAKERRVYVTDNFISELKIIKSDCALIFNINGKKISTRSVNKFLENSYKEGILDFPLSSHVFRHSFATAMLENNADIRHIQKLLGHSSISTTEIYTKVARSRKKVILDTYHPLKNKL